MSCFTWHCCISFIYELGGVVSEPLGIWISRCVFKYCCGAEFPSILRTFARLYLLSPRYTSGGSRGGAWGAHPLFLDQTEARRAEKIFLRDRPPAGSGTVYWLQATHCWGNHSSCAPLPTFTFIYLCEPTNILVHFGW